tara:strand:+ start:1854 stop:2453 length:600 start_codon:yes stop_codon:yes gene_type:complete
VKRLLLLLLPLTLYLLSIFFNPHRLRSSFIRTIAFEDLKRIYDVENSQSIPYFFEDTTYLSKFEKFIPNDLRNTSDQKTTINVLQFSGNNYTNNNVKFQTLIPEYPELILDNLVHNKMRGTCYNDAILFNTLLQSVNIKSRLISFNGDDGLGGNGHTLSEVYFSDYKKWCVIDPQQIAYFTDNNYGHSIISCRAQKKST